MMERQMSMEEAYQRAEAWYAAHKTELETPENIGRRISVDVTTGNWAFNDQMGLRAPAELRERNPEAQPFGLRIGYKAAISFGGSRTRRD